MEMRPGFMYRRLSPLWAAFREHFIADSEQFGDNLIAVPRTEEHSSQSYLHGKIMVGRGFRILIPL